MSLPRIYILVETPVLGELGENTIVRREKACEDCGRLELVRERVDFKFDRWNGEDLFTAYGLLFVTERLKEAFETAGVTGLVCTESHRVKGPHFKFGKQAPGRELPPIFWTEAPRILKSPDSWWKRLEVCPSCGDQKFGPTREGIRASGGPSTTGTRKDVENPLPLTVFKEGWKGEDIFRLEQPVHPIVTEAFKVIVEKLGNEKVTFRPTDWA